MSISERPWRIAPGFEHDYIKSADGSVVSVENQPHVVACVNTIHSSGITPEALARDPECVKKLVEAAREHLESVARCALDDGTPTRSICQGDADDLESALRACGIEVPA